MASTAEPSAVLTLQEKGRIRYHLGYTTIQPVASIVLGVYGTDQTQYLLEANMDRIPASQVGQVRRLVSILDGIEDKLIAAQDRKAARQVDEITLNPDEPDELDREHLRWATRLSSLLAAPLNPQGYGARFGMTGPQPLSIPVRH